MERVRGHVRLAKDPQRIYNSRRSAKLTETNALTPIERPIFYPEQVAGLEQSWADANINRSPYQLINPMIDPGTGQPFPPAPLTTLVPPQMAPVLAALIQITASDIGELTTNLDNSDQVRSNVSAEAMDMAATRTDAKSFVYMDNMRQSMQRCGEIYYTMAKSVYVEEGREVPTMDQDGQQGAATLQEPTTDDRGRFYIANDFSSGKFHVIADVSEATTTRRDKTVKAMVASAQVTAPFDPEGAAAMIGIALMNMDGELPEGFEDWNRQRLVAKGIVKPTDEEKKAMEDAAKNAQPDPQVKMVEAQSELAAAAAQKEAALAEKARQDTLKSQADTQQSEAKTTLTLAQAHKTAADTHKDTIAGRVAKMLGFNKGA
jgi:hypothetical protein